MRRTHDEWETTGGSNWRTPRGGAGRPRMVTLEEPWQSNLYSIPRPTRWTPEAAAAMDDHRTRDYVDRTPHPLQSPPFRVNASNDEIQYLKERMHRQEDMMEKMMNEITLLRLELKEKKEKSSKERADTTKPPDADDIGAGSQPSHHTASRPAPPNNEEARQRERSFPETRTVPLHTESRYRGTKGSVGAHFVAEISEFIELDNGQHELLASIIDEQASRRSRSTRF
jgi:hypothetical protein